MNTGGIGKPAQSGINLPKTQRSLGERIKAATNALFGGKTTQIEFSKGQVRQDAMAALRRMDPEQKHQALRESIATEFANSSAVQSELEKKTTKQGFLSGLNRLWTAAKRFLGFEGSVSIQGAIEGYQKAKQTALQEKAQQQIISKPPTQKNPEEPKDIHREKTREPADRIPTQATTKEARTDRSMPEQDAKALNETHQVKAQQELISKLSEQQGSPAFQELLKAMKMDSQAEGPDMEMFAFLFAESIFGDQGLTAANIEALASHETCGELFEQFCKDYLDSLDQGSKLPAKETLERLEDIYRGKTGEPVDRTPTQATTKEASTDRSMPELRKVADSEKNYHTGVSEAVRQQAAQDMARTKTLKEVRKEVFEGIQGFDKSNLRHVETDDRSKPVLPKKQDAIADIQPKALTGAESLKQPESVATTVRINELGADGLAAVTNEMAGVAIDQGILKDKINEVILSYFDATDNVLRDDYAEDFGRFVNDSRNFDASYRVLNESEIKQSFESSVGGTQSALGLSNQEASKLNTEITKMLIGAAPGHIPMASETAPTEVAQQMAQRRGGIEGSYPEQIAQVIANSTEKIELNDSEFNEIMDHIGHMRGTLENNYHAGFGKEGWNEFRSELRDEIQNAFETKAMEASEEDW